MESVWGSFKKKDPTNVWSLFWGLYSLKPHRTSGLFEGL